MCRHIDFYVTATEKQRTLLIEQFEKYQNYSPTVYTIPVGSLSKLRKPGGQRKKHSFITASRLATEKHVDWLVAAVAGIGIGKLQDKGLSVPALGVFIILSLVTMIGGFLFSDSILAIVLIAAVFSIAVQGISVLSQARLFALSNEERSRLNTVFVVSNFLFGAVGSALASFLWAQGGWSYVMIGAILISLMALIVWISSRNPFYEVDNNAS
jgi:hypothetical protein